MQVRLATAVVALSLALAGCGGDGPPPQPAEPEGPWFGFNDSSPIGGTVTPAQSADLAARAGANSVRLVIAWEYVEGRPGAVNLKIYDAVYRAHLARGSHPLISITGAPRWAWPPEARCGRRECRYPPGAAHDADWARFVGLVARRFPRAAGIEVWNEPNERSQWLPAPDPARYTELLALAYDAVKAVDAGMPVVGGSLSANLDPGMTPPGMGLVTFLDGMYEAGARGKMDGLAIHPYPVPGRLGRAGRVIKLALESRDRHDDDVPLWLTEIGLSSTDQASTEELQAEALTQLLPALRERSDVEAVYVHTLVEPVEHPEGSLDRGYGVVRPDLSPKPAYCVLAADSPGCPQ